MNVWGWYASLPLGLIAGLHYLPWMWVVLVMWVWFLIDPSRWNHTLRKLTVVVFILHALFCVYGCFSVYIHSFFQSVSSLPSIITFILILSNIYIVLRYCQLRNMPNTSGQLFICITILICNICFVGHIILVHWAGLPFSIHKWMYIFLLLQLFSLLNPTQNINQSILPVPSLVKALIILIMTLMVGVHWIRYAGLSQQLQQGNDFRAAAVQAVKAGYIQTAIHAVLNESARLVSSGEMDEAILYLRTQWEYLPKEQLAEQYRKHVFLRDNPFLFLCVFGGRLDLHGDDITDGILIKELRQYIIATDAGNLFTITSDAINPLPFQYVDLQQLHYEPDTGTLYGIYKNQSVFIRNGDDIDDVHLGHEHRWVDVALSADGQTFWVLHSRGGIAAYQKTNREWKFKQELYSALWFDVELAIGLLHQKLGEEDIFYILDSHKGITARVPAGLQDQVLPKKDLYRFYHPERAYTADAKFYQGKIVIADQFGQMDFIGKGVGDDFTEWKYSIRADSRFDRQSGIWLRDDNTVSLIAYPEAGIIVQLKRNGIFEVIAMPQGFRIPQLKRNGWWDIPQSIE